MILCAETIKEMNILTPCLSTYKVNGVSGGLSYCGYDIALDQDLNIPKNGFVLGSSVEHFDMPLNVVGFQKDKSTWARRGIAVQSTVLEPGWKGYLTIEISNHGHEDIFIQRGTPIAQIIFNFIDRPVRGYEGKYQNQKRGPQEAIFERSNTKWDPYWL